MQFQGKRVLITGGGRGIGRSIAIHLGKQGAELALVARTLEELEVTREMAMAAGASGVEVFVGDVGERELASLVISRWTSQNRPLHGLVCAAAVMGEIQSLELATLEEWERTYRVNVLGSAAFAKEVIPIMRRSGGGRIVFFSGGGQGGQPRRTAYASSKGAIWRLTESLAAELVTQGIYVNAVAPGAVNTKFLKDVLEAGPERAGAKEYAEALEQEKKGGNSPELAAKLVQYLLEERSAGLTGKILSAVWDPYEEFAHLEEMSRSDIFTVRRVVDKGGSTRVR
jgi:NAD(P)-dependent dehydrogenase (short-subunit alcohol dehydrogenase family)